VSYIINKYPNDYLFMYDSRHRFLTRLMKIEHDDIINESKKINDMFRIKNFIEL
jgi:hypothetical protein